MMGLRYVNLDDKTRQFMLQEFDEALESNSLHFSPRLSAQGEIDWPALLRKAAETGNDDSLADELRARGSLNDKEASNRKGGIIMVKVPATAPETLAESEFNRLYARGLCRRAIAEGTAEVVAYRAKDVSKPRAASEKMIGRRFDAGELLRDLRSSSGVELALGVPSGPNSGMIVRLP